MADDKELDIEAKRQFYRDLGQSPDQTQGMTQADHDLGANFVPKEYNPSIPEEKATLHGLGPAVVAGITAGDVDRAADTLHSMPPAAPEPGFSASQAVSDALAEVTREREFADVVANLKDSDIGSLHFKRDTDLPPAMTLEESLAAIGEETKLTEALLRGDRNAGLDLTDAEIDQAIQIEASLETSRPAPSRPTSGRGR